MNGEEKMMLSMLGAQVKVKREYKKFQAKFKGTGVQPMMRPEQPQMQMTPPDQQQTPITEGEVEYAR